VIPLMRPGAAGATLRPMSSHITILASGPRGDVQPYVALALGLQAAGHEVTLAADAGFRPLAASHGVPFRPLAIDDMALADSAEGRAALGTNPLVAMRRMRDSARPMIRRMLDDAWRAAQDTDAIVYHPKTLAGPHLAERLGVPAVVAAPVPVLSPTRAFPLPGVVDRGLGGKLNRASYRLTAVSAGMFRGTVDAWRAEALDLPPAPHGVRDVAPDGSPLPRLYAYSEAVLPRPSDWGADTTVSGYWPLGPEPGWAPPEALERFLADGPAPVYVGFGSMPLDDARATAGAVVAGLRAIGARGLLDGPLGAAPGDAVGPDARDMLAIAGVPHVWLFDRVRAVVHHGGAGTTGAGLRAGRPTVIVPHAVDQPFWARVVHERGAAPGPIAADRLDAQRLAAALTEATGAPIASRAAALGRTLRREDGIAAAVRFVGGAIAGARGNGSPPPARHRAAA
jgi:sterol 3beta-glucosyltransferase